MDESTGVGEVLIGIKLDASGNASSVRTIRAASPELGRSCRSAIAYAAPFGLLPASLGFLNGEEITLELSASRSDPAPIGTRPRSSPKATR